MELAYGWLCEPEAARYGPWIGDAPYAKANSRRSHLVTVRDFSSLGGVQRLGFGMALVNPKNLFEQVFYGNPVVNPKDMTGFSSFYNNIDPNLTQNAENVIDGNGGGPSLTSIWVVCWGLRTVFMVTPDGEPLSSLGDIALAVADWRYVVRVANVDPEAPQEAIATFINRALVRLPYAGPERDTTRTTIYLNESLHNSLRAQTHRKIFVRKVELRNNESRVGGEPTVSG